MPPKEMLNYSGDIHARLSIVETKVDYVEESLSENKEHLTGILKKMDDLSTQMTHQCALFPRLEETVNKTLEHVSSQEKVITMNHLRSKITWGIIASLITGVIVMFIKLKLGA